MLPKKRLLYVVHELSPYLELTEFAEWINKLVIKANSSGFEVRCMMPRFRTINERRHKLHEVLRLTGINIHLGAEEYPLQIKVASLGNARVQVYFLENEDLFENTNLFHNEQKDWDKNNGMKSLFFCKGVIETLKKFSWPPDLIHCSGWMASFLPLLIKKTYKKEPVFLHARLLYTVCQHFFDQTLEADVASVLKKEFGIENKDLALFKPFDNDALYKGAMYFADALSIENPADTYWRQYASSTKGKKIFPPQAENEVPAMMDFYHDLVIHP